MLDGDGRWRHTFDNAIAVPGQVFALPHYPSVVNTMTVDIHVTCSIDNPLLARVLSPLNSCYLGSFMWLWTIHCVFSYAVIFSDMYALLALCIRGVHTDTSSL